MRASAALVLALVLASGAASAQQAPNDDDVWAAARGPTSDSGHVIGAYTNGCVAGAAPLPLDGPGFSVIRPQRNRFWGHPSLIGFVNYFGKAMQDAGLGRLMIADLGQPRGGPISGHASHELGLDVDIWLRRIVGGGLSAAERADPTAISVLTDEGSEINREVWSAEIVEMYRIAASYPTVERIFANPLIKRELCETVTGDRSWLSRIRAWYGHDSHMHVRLACPPDSPECRPQAPVPEGDGCGAELDWWFTDEPYKPHDDSGPFIPPPLPEGCGAVLRR